MFRLNASVLAVALICTLRIAAGASSPNEQLPAGPMQEKAAAACLSCHEARIIVQQRLSKAAWTREMDKMVKWGAEVDPQDRDALNRLLQRELRTGPTSVRSAENRQCVCLQIALEGKALTRAVRAAVLAAVVGSSRPPQCCNAAIRYSGLTLFPLDPYHRDGTRRGDSKRFV
jgi:hypothetical protein